jgi:hypothetical protein
VEGRVVRLAGRQDGVISRFQLRAVSVDDDWIDHRKRGVKFDPTHVAATLKAVA